MEGRKSQGRGCSHFLRQEIHEGRGGMYRAERRWFLYDRNMRPGRPQRLPRDRYIGERTVAFHATTWDRARVFVADPVVEHQIMLLERASKMHGCVVPVYCFMPDHAHIMLMGLGPTSDLLGAMTKFKTLSGTWLHGQGLPRWQKDFYDHVMRAGEDWRNHARYIAENPVRAGLASDWSVYPYTGSIGCDLQDIVSGFR